MPNVSAMIVPWLFVLVRSIYLSVEWKQRTLPMQWDLAGRVIWSAPKIVALGFIPLVGGLAIAAMARKADGQSPGKAIAVGLGILLIHLVYTHYARRYT